MAIWDDTTTTGNTTAGGPWQWWTTNITASVTADAWVNWTGTVSTTANYPIYGTPLPAQPPAPDKAALKKARALLYMLLDHKERRRYRKHGHVRIKGGDGADYVVCRPSHHVGMTYRIEADGSVKKFGLCQTGVGFCEDDRVAAVILALRFDVAEAARRWHSVPIDAGEHERIARLAA